MTTRKTPQGQALSELVIAVFRLHGLLVEAGDTLAAPSGQTTSRWQVLGCIDDAPDSVASIARRMGLARQSVQRTADLLVDEGSARYVRNPAHRRAKLVAITPAGLRALRSIEQRQAVWANALGHELGQAALRKVASTLDELSNRLGPAATG